MRRPSPPPPTTTHTQRTWQWARWFCMRKEEHIANVDKGRERQALSLSNGGWKAACLWWSLLPVTLHIYSRGFKPMKFLVWVLGFGVCMCVWKVMRALNLVPRTAQTRAEAKTQRITRKLLPEITEILGSVISTSHKIAFFSPYIYSNSWGHRVPDM